MSRIKREREEFGPYFRRLADAMALKDWVVEVLDESTGTDDDIASIARPTGRKCAQVRLSEAFLRDVESEQRHTAVHELIHCHLSPVDFFVEKILTPEQFESYCLLREYAVDGIADGWAPLMPLPEQAESKK